MSAGYAVVLFKCPVHNNYDSCLTDTNCLKHPNRNVMRAYEHCICSCYLHDMERCSCSCHLIPLSQREQDCACCWPRSKVTDLYDDLRVFPWASSLDRRRYWRGGNGDHMFMHVSWSIRADDQSKSLFYSILRAVNPSFPIDPLYKADFKVDVCSECKGLVWENCVVGPNEMRAAARQVAAVSGTPFDLRVHSWKRSSKCRTWKRQAVPLAEACPEPRPTELAPATTGSAAVN